MADLFQLTCSQDDLPVPVAAVSPMDGGVVADSPPPLHLDIDGVEDVSSPAPGDLAAPAEHVVQPPEERPAPVSRLNLEVLDFWGPSGSPALPPLPAAFASGLLLLRWSLPEERCSSRAPRPPALPQGASSLLRDPDSCLCYQCLEDALRRS